MAEQYAIKDARREGEFAIVTIAVPSLSEAKDEVAKKLAAARAAELIGRPGFAGYGPCAYFDAHGREVPESEYGLPMEPGGHWLQELKFRPGIGI